MTKRLFTRILWKIDYSIFNHYSQQFNDIPVNDIFNIFI